MAMMIVGRFFNCKDHTYLNVVLPTTFEKLLNLFEEKTEILTTRNSYDFKCVYFDCDYCCGYEDSTFEEVNKIAKKLDGIGKNYTEKELAAYFEKYGLENIDLIKDFKFYTSKEDFTNKLYKKYGLTDTKFLWTTVDNFLDDEVVFEEFCLAGNSYQAANGVVVEIE